MTSESQPRVMSILEVFPMELLAEIRSHIPQKDLRTNVCFHNTCPLFASLFGPAEDQRVFWEGACLLVGLGCLPGETPHEVDWKRVALEYIEKDGFCGHPECSSNRLQNNGQCCIHSLKAQTDSILATYMAEMSNLSCWDKFEVYGELEDTPEDSQVHVNPLLSHIGFETDASEWDPLPEEEDAYLRYGGNSETPSGQNRYLWDHPIACRSFAMFPPLQRMPRWNHFRGFYGIVNVSGITVWDIQAAFWET